jgi:hypothetical protein
METEHGWLQPVLIDRVSGGTFCPAEGGVLVPWGRISNTMGFWPVLCQASGLQHTGFPDPITRRRMRRAFKRR